MTDDDGLPSTLGHAVITGTPDAVRRPGDVVAGRYVIVSLLGTGGMGAVYRASHGTLGETIALKFLKRFVAHMSEMRERFHREAKILAKLRHPSVVTVLDFGEDQGELFMAMELVQGDSLSAVVGAPAPPLPLPRLGAIFGPILEVLQTAHDAGIVHRDLKPDNVMLLQRAGVAGQPPAELVKVLDFGLALLEGPGDKRLTQTGMVCGTPQYMSPEQCRGERVGPATDIYAVGVMLHEALTSELPFKGRDAVELMAQHLYVEPPRLSECKASVDAPAGLEALVREALAKAPEDRPTAARLRERLAEALAGTDARSLAQNDAAERARVGALTREERALGGLAGGAAAPAPAKGGHVILWGVTEPQGTELRTALAMAGALVRKRNAVTVPLEIADDPPPVVVLEDSEDAVARMTQVREASSRPLAVIVIGVRTSERLTQLIRAGVTDAAHSSLATGEVAKKVRRCFKSPRRDP